MQRKCAETEDSVRQLRCLYNGSGLSNLTICIARHIIYDPSSSLYANANLLFYPTSETNKPV
jgi:hypothetical protein